MPKKVKASLELPKRFNVDRKRIREWQSAKAKLLAADNKRKHLEGGGRKPFDVGLEDELLEWVHERRSSGLRVSRKMISHKARAIHEQKCKAAQLSSSFIASNGWVQKFMGRNGLSVRRRTTESEYILQVRRQRNRLSYSHSDIIAMDETAVWQDMLSSTNLVPRVSLLPAPKSERERDLALGGGKKRDPGNEVGPALQ